MIVERRVIAASRKVVRRVPGPAGAEGKAGATPSEVAGALAQITALADGYDQTVNGPEGLMAVRDVAAKAVSRAGLAAAKDAAEFATFQSDADIASIFLRAGSAIALPAKPTKPVHGPGSLTFDGVTVTGFNVDFDAVFSNIDARPQMYGEVKNGIFGTPDVSGGEDFFNVIFAPGMNRNPSGRIYRSTLMGVGIGRVVQTFERVDGFGQSVFGLARWGHRNAHFGTLGQQWGGQDLTTDPTGKFYQHNLWWNDGTPITDPAWDAYQLKTISPDTGNPANPGIRERIAAWANWATSKDDWSFNDGFARDCLCEILRGTYNSAKGYRSLCLLVEGMGNTAKGAFSLYRLVFGTGNTGEGYQAGSSLVEGSYNTYKGFNAGYSHRKGERGTAIGVNAGYSSSGFWVGDRWLLLGQDAGRKPDGTMEADLTDKGYIQNRYTHNPILSFDFLNDRAGVNVPIGTALKALCHAFAGSSGGTGVVAKTVAQFLAESDDHGGYLVRTPATKIGGYYFGDDADDQAGGVTYDHSTDQLRLRAGAGNRVFVTSAAMNLGVPINRSGVQVVNTRKTGWATPTGTATRTTFDTATATTQQLAERLKALIDDLHFATSGHGLIGT